MSGIQVVGEFEGKRGEVERNRWIEFEALGTSRYQRRRNDLLFAAAAVGCVDVVSILLESGADVNAVTVRKQTAIHFAAKHGHVDIVKVLIKNGADAVDWR